MFSSSPPSSFFAAQNIGVRSPSSPTSRDTVRFQPTRISASCTSTARTPAMTSAPSPSSLYDVLGVQMGATCQEIKTAYRKLARVCHPDVVAMNQKDSSADEFMKIHSAYLTLSDPTKRADYDRSLFKRPRQSATSSSGFSGYTPRRNWETDQCW